MHVRSLPSMFLSPAHLKKSSVKFPLESASKPSKHTQQAPQTKARTTPSNFILELRKRVATQFNRFLRDFAQKMQTQKQRLPGKRSRLIIVYGFLCDKHPQHMRNLQRQMENLQKNTKKFASVEVHCNTETPGSMTTNILARLFLKKDLEPTPFVKKIFGRVLTSLYNNEHVVLVGHSYGGSVVSRVAMELNHLQKLKNVKFDISALTFGSIYIPSPKYTSGINIQHIAYDKNIAKLCSGVSPHVKNLRHRKGKGPVAAHMNYHGHICQLAKSGTLQI